MAGPLMTKSAEVVKWCKAKGWYDQPVSVLTAMALLHSEISEALEAHRQWGVKDATAPYEFALGTPNQMTMPKPEGVGSEFADCLIRLLDDCARHSVDLDAAVAKATPFMPPPSPLGFYDVMALFHEQVSKVVTISIDTDDSLSEQFAVIYRFLVHCCERYGVDLEAEYDRKMAYNWTRAYKHGGKDV